MSYGWVVERQGRDGVGRGLGVEEGGGFVWWGEVGMEGGGERGDGSVLGVSTDRSSTAARGAYAVHGTRHDVRGTRRAVRGEVCESHVVHDTQYAVCRTTSRYGTRYGIRGTIHGTIYVVRGTIYLVCC